MKKFKIAICTLAIVLAVGGAFASNFKKPCDTSANYYWNGVTYVDAGIFGVDYACNTNSATCTYWRPDPINQPFYYEVCKQGEFIQIGH